MDLIANAMATNQKRKNTTARDKHYIISNKKDKPVFDKMNSNNFKFCRF